jgi:hypothetical protein
MPEKHSFKLEVLGRYQARNPQNENSVTANLVAGDEEGHYVYAGTITMSQSQFETFTKALGSALDGRFALDEWHLAEPDEAPA